MPSPALLLILATLLPLAAFVVLLFFGRRLGNPLSGIFSTVFIAASFVLAMFAMMQWLSAGTEVGSLWGAGKLPIYAAVQWLPTGPAIGQDHPGFLDASIYVDSLTVAMFSMITLVATLVQIFSIRYMRKDARFSRYFAYLSLFCFSMLALVLGGTLLQVFVCWELVGICSYLLIGFWYEKREAADAAIKAFITNRVGDTGFLIALGILIYHVGGTAFPRIWVLLGSAGHGQAITLPSGQVYSSLLLTLTGIGFFCGAIAKSAQFPLHVWLPDAMEGPTPVSALIHAATMVAAGVYLLARIFPILTPDAKLFIAIIGCITLTFAALIAVVQSDIKKVLAYSTISQLGYMILALGIGSWIGGTFHLITHAFFKSLLFLGAGSVIHSAMHERELPQFGGLIRKLPVTGITFAIATLAISATPFFSGYYSKDLILTDAASFVLLAQSQLLSHWYWLLFILPVIVAYITPFYMMRCWMLAFWGKPRNMILHDHVRESATFYFPLVALAVLCVLGGSFMGVRELLEKSPVETKAMCDAMILSDPAYKNCTSAAFDTAWPTSSTVESADEQLTKSDTVSIHAGQIVQRYSGWAFAAGILLAFAIYFNGYSVAMALMKITPLRWIHAWLYRGMYIDELYFAMLIAPVVGISRLLALFDRYVIDGLVNFAGYFTRQTAIVSDLVDRFIIDGLVSAVADSANGMGLMFRSRQTGRIRSYVLMLMAVVSLALAVMILVVLSK